MSTALALNERNIFNLFQDDLREFLTPTKVYHEATQAQVIENEKEYIYFTDLPGVTKDEIKIEVENNLLHIRAHRKNLHEDALYNSVDFGDVHHSYRLKKDHNGSTIKAKLENGVLQVTIQKVEKPQPIEISIE